MKILVVLAVILTTSASALAGRDSESAGGSSSSGEFRAGPKLGIVIPTEGPYGVGWGIGAYGEYVIPVQQTSFSVAAGVVVDWTFLGGYGDRYGYAYESYGWEADESFIEIAPYASAVIRPAETPVEVFCGAGPAIRLSRFTSSSHYRPSSFKHSETEFDVTAFLGATYHLPDSPLLVSGQGRIHGLDDLIGGSNKGVPGAIIEFSISVGWALSSGSAWSGGGKSGW